MDGYRSLDVWKLAHELCIRTLRGVDAAYRPRSRALLDQVRRAVLSVETNIVEGYALGARMYFLKHLRIAFGSAAEADCLIRDAAEMEYLPPDLVAQLQLLVDRLLQVLRGLLRRDAG